MKSKISKDARHNSLELANSKFVLPRPPIELLSLNPLPSSKFFLTLNLGSGGFFLASPVLKKPSFAQELRAKNIMKHEISFLFKHILNI
jgi:hypothetical protein